MLTNMMGGEADEKMALVNEINAAAEAARAVAKMNEDGTKRDRDAEGWRPSEEDKAVAKLLGGNPLVKGSERSIPRSLCSDS